LGGHGSGRRKGYEAMDTEELIHLSIRTLLLFLKDDTQSLERRVAVASIIASRRIGNKQEIASTITLDASDRLILQRYGVAVEDGIHKTKYELEQLKQNVERIA
jgi:hypothetical protein